MTTVIMTDKAYSRPAPKASAAESAPTAARFFALGAMVSYSKGTQRPHRDTGTKDVQPQETKVQNNPVNQSLSST